jgi:hypothetical protein
VQIANIDIKSEKAGLTLERYKFKKALELDLERITREEEIKWF